MTEDRPPVAWVLNLDAESELQDPVGYVRSRRMRLHLERLGRTLAGRLPPGDLWVREDTPPGSLGPGWTGRAWCPTPGARSRLAEVGAEPEECPSLEVLREVNGRRFAAALEARGLPGSDRDEAELPGAVFLETTGDLEDWLRGPGERSRLWVAKSAYGFAGRGQRRFTRGQLDEAGRTWLRKRLGEGDGLQVEPWVERVLDCSLHGWLPRCGPPHLGPPRGQRVDDAGRWLASYDLQPGVLAGHELELLGARAEQLAGALREAGYWGPFGFDAFRWRDPSGCLRMRTLSDIHGRYSMGSFPGLDPTRAGSVAVLSPGSGGVPWGRERRGP